MYFIAKTIIKGDKRMANVNEKAIEAFLTKIKDDSNFAQKICDAHEPGEVQILAKEVGIELAMDDIMATKGMLVKAMEKDNHELSDEDLENVAGGFGILAGIAAVALIAGVTGIITSSGAASRWKW
jgi:predicted ribosomally synthesized peptide with nif11-like leader